MAALLRHVAARRLAGSMLQRSETAVAEGRRRLGPRTMHTDDYEKARGKVRHKIDQKKEELYDVMSKLERSFGTPGFENKGLLQHLALHVKPKPDDSQWHSLCFSRKARIALDTAGFITSAGVFAYFVVQFNRI